MLCWNQQTSSRGVDVQDKDGLTLLHWASREGRMHDISSLIEHGADRNSRDNNWLTPLHWASRNEHVNGARLLLEHGAEVSSRDERGWTPLH
jgi:serine/threonine-protein phosphatase 6 regulatory ankyrin repeat subunit B